MIHKVGEAVSGVPEAAFFLYNKKFLFNAETKAREACFRFVFTFTHRFDKINSVTDSQIVWKGG